MFLYPKAPLFKSTSIAFIAHVNRSSVYEAVNMYVTLAHFSLPYLRTKVNDLKIPRVQASNENQDVSNNAVSMSLC